MVHVAYRSSSLAITDLIGGQIQMALGSTLGVASHVNAGRLRSVAVTSGHRASSMPEVPTMREAGYPGFDVVAWFGMFAPAGTPAPIVERINRELVAVLNQPELRARGAELGIDIFSSTPAELGQYVKSQIALWGQLTADAGLVPE